MCWFNWFVPSFCVFSLVAHCQRHVAIAIAVGRDVFRPDSSTFIELLMRIQSAPPRYRIVNLTNVYCTGDADSPLDPGDVMLNHYLIATWAKVCQALGPEFEPYLPIVMPPLLQAASAKADVNVWGETREFLRKSETLCAYEYD